eukprot:GGOE01014315.1.p1 GENE.GGOE01014315.1~~GGOE01014315.1.p1  ORF type:complete len:741 (+),score=211.83 GGOE01014315.1:42-2264(+)
MGKSYVKVIIRVRPTDKFAQDCLKLEEDGKTIQVHLPKRKRKEDYINNQQEDFMFKYDGILHNASQETVHSQVGQGIVQSVLDGYNATAICYGQTGAGKTYTMTGGNDFKQRGLVPRAIAQVFNDIVAKPEQSFQIRVSYMEIYNERIYDLLRDPGDAPSEELQIQEDPKGNISVRNLYTPVATKEEDALSFFFEGNANRAIAEHQLNATSSRSHCIFTIYVSSRSRVESDGTTIHSKVHFIDLAGSERLSKTGSEGVLAKEAMYINRSLSFLEQVVIALSNSAREHVPYRQSRLTNLLKDSLGGNCKTVMISNIWAEEQHLEETSSTLKFATRMMRVQNEAVVNSSLDAEAQIRRMAKEIAELKSELQMQNQLHGKSHVTYGDDFAEDERFEIQKQVRDFCDGKLKDLEFKSLRQSKEMFRVFKNFVNSAESDGGRHTVPSVTFGLPQKASAQEGAVRQDDGVGDMDPAAGFGIGTAIPGKLDKATRETILSARALAVVSPGREEKAANGASTDFAADGQMPDRNQAFEAYKTRDGAAVAETLKRLQASVREKKRQLKELATRVNDCKVSIDDVRLKVQAKKQEEDEDAATDIVDAEYFRALTQLRDQKNAYRTLYDQMQAVKAECDYDARLLEQTRTKLIVDFTHWYDDTYGAPRAGMPPIGNSTSVTSPFGRSSTNSKPSFDDDPMDEQDRFEALERARILAQDPESSVYYSAKKAATLGKSQGYGARKPAAAARKR